MLNQSQFNAFAIFTIDRNNGNNEDSSDSVAKIILNKIKYRSDKFSDNIAGQIMNVGNGTVENLQVIFTYYNKKGELIGSDFTYTNPDTLKPGQKAPFNKLIDEKTGDDVKAFEVSLTWNNPDGTEEYIENVDVEQENENIFIFQENKKSKKLTDEEIEKLGLFER